MDLIGAVPAKEGGKVGAEGWRVGFGLSVGLLIFACAHRGWLWNRGGQCRLLGFPFRSIISGRTTALNIPKSMTIQLPSRQSQRDERKFNNTDNN